MLPKSKKNRSGLNVEDIIKVKSDYGYSNIYYDIPLNDTSVSNYDYFALCNSAILPIKILGLTVAISYSLNDNENGINKIIYSGWIRGIVKHKGKIGKFKSAGFVYRAKKDFSQEEFKFYKGKNELLQYDSAKSRLSYYSLQEHLKLFLKGSLEDFKIASFYTFDLPGQGRFLLVKLDQTDPFCDDNYALFRIDTKMELITCRFFNCDT